jgi:hypothetical protein
MPGPFHGWLYTVGADGTTSELINHARTAAYLRGFGLPNGMTICDVIDDGGCALYPYTPPCGDPVDWEPMVFVDPATDGAPWYTAANPESADALGLWIEEWTGLDNAHVRRTVAPRGGGGAQLGTLNAGERVMALNALLFARSEAAMEHLFRWFEQTLSNVCSTCATDSMLIRRYCGSGDPWDGVARLNQVGLVAGPQWEAEPTNTGRCFLRRISFTLTAGDPCMYLPTVDAGPGGDVADVAACLDGLLVDPARQPCRPSCTEVTDSDSCRSVYFYDVPPTAAAQVPIVTLFNDATEHSLPVRLICYADPLGIETAPSLTDPCRLPVLGELYVRPLAPGATLVWDVAARDVTYHDSTTEGMEPGWGHIDPNDPPLRRWFALPCGQVIITVEVSTACLQVLPSGAYSDGAHLYETPHYPTVSVEIGERVGCP